MVETGKEMALTVFYVFAAWVVYVLGWTFLLFLSWDVLNALLPLFEISKSEAVVVEALFSGASYFLLPLVLLIGTKFHWRLNRSMIWVQIFEAFLCLLKALLMGFGIKLYNFGMFYFYDFEVDGGWSLIAILLLRWVCWCLGIMVFILLNRRYSISANLHAR